MIYRQMKFLYLIGLCLRHMDTDVRIVLEFVLLLTCKTDDLHATGLSYNRCIKHILAVTGSGDSEKNIPFLAEIIHLLSKAEQRLTVIHISSSQSWMTIEGNGRKSPLKILCENLAQFCIHSF